MAHSAGQGSGKPRVSSCGACDSALPGIARFCPFCGLSLAPSRERESAGPAVELAAGGEAPRRAAPLPSGTTLQPVSAAKTAKKPAPPLEAPAEPTPASSPNASPQAGHETGARAHESLPEARPRRARWWLRAAVVALFVVGLVQLLPEDAARPTVERSSGNAEAGATPPAAGPPVAMADEQRAVRRVRSDLSSSALVRDYPSTEQGRVLTSLAPGTEIETTGRVAGVEWQRVALRGHPQAYIHNGLLGEEVPSRPASRVAGRLAGAADTATLRVDGHEVRLYGIAPGTREPYTTELSHFVRDHGDEVECTHVEAGLYRCGVAARDLGEIILLNGAARTSSKAPQTYVDNESVAREEGRGLWAR